MFSRLVVGALAMLVAFGPLVAGAGALRRRLLPTWTGAPSALVQIVVVLTTLLLAIEILGVIGLFSAIPMVLLLAAIGAGLLLLAARTSPRHDAPEACVEPSRLGLAGNLVAVVASTVFAASWGARTFGSWNHGMVSIDTLWYHMPTAGRFAQEGSITGVYHDFGGVSGFYPVALELQHSFGMVVLDNDFLSPALNLGWGVVALLAAWCIGRPFGLSVCTFTGAAVLLCAPGFITTQPAGGHSDVVGVALALSTAAILLTAGHRRLTSDPVVIALAALPIGFAMSTKWTLIPVSAAMTLGVIVLLARGQRLRLGAVWLVTVVVVGGFSYLRNLLDVGNPLPALGLKIGPLGWESKVPQVSGTAALAGHLLDGSAWSDYFLEGLSLWYGYVWWAVLLVIFVGLILPLVTGPGPVVRMLAAVGVAAAIGYVFAPQLLEVGGDPVFFVSNFRYAAAAMALALVLLPLSPRLSRPVFTWAVLGGYLLLILVMQLDSAIWPTELRDLRIENPVRGADAWAGLVIALVVLGAGLALVLRGRRRDEVPIEWRRPALVSLAVAAVLLVALLVGGQRWYLDQRYATPDEATPAYPRHWKSWVWARDQQFERIGFKNSNLYYPLMGNDQSNTTDYIGLAPNEPSTSPADTAATCRDLKDAVNAGDFTYVVIYGFVAPLTDDVELPDMEEVAPEVVWLEDDPATSVVLRAPLEVVFAIDGELDTGLCAEPG